MKKKVLRITTVPVSLDLLLKGQLKMLNEMYEVVAVSSPGKELEEVGKREGIRTVAKVRFFLELAKVFHFFLESHLADIQQTKLSCGEREESPQNNSL